MADIDFDWDGLREMQKDLRICATDAIPYASRDALNSTAFEARKTWQGEMAKTFTLRNQFTQRSVRVEKVSHATKDINRMQAVIGSVAPYLDEQEEGATMLGDGGHSYPTPVRTNPKRPVTRRNWQPNIKLWGGRPKFGSPKQRNAINISRAMRAGGQMVIPLQTRYGTVLARTMPTGETVKLKILWNLTRTSVRVSPHKTLEPTMQEVERLMPRAMIKAIVFQMRRRRVLGY